MLKVIQGMFSGSQIVKTTLKKIRIGSITLLDLKTYYRATAIKTVSYWHRDRHVN